MYIPNCHSMRNSIVYTEYMAVQTSTKLYYWGITFITPWDFKIHIMNPDEPCTYTSCIHHVQYMSCIYNVQHCMHPVHTVLNSMKYVQTCTWHVQTCIYIDINLFSCIFMYIHGQTMYIACACRPCTISCVCEHENQKVKICYVLSSNPWPCACRMIALTTALLAFMNCYPLCQYISTVVPGGWWRTSGAGPAAPPAPAMTSPAAGPIINMDLVEAEVHREAGLPDASAAALRPGRARLRNSPGRVTWRAAGSCSIDTD